MPASDEQWLAVARILEPCGDADVLAHWTRVATPTAIAASASRLKIFAKLGKQCVPLLLELDPMRRAALASSALRDVQGIDELAEALVLSHGGAFEGKLLFQTYAALLGVPSGRAAIVAITSDRKASDETRIAALEIAATQRDLAEEVFATRFGNLLDTDRVRTRRSALKKAYKAAASGPK